jgi:transposase
MNELERQLKGPLDEKFLARVNRLKFDDTAQGTSAQLCIKRLVSQIRGCGKQIEQIDTKLQELIDAENNPLTSIAGVGVTSAASIIAHTGDVRRFKNKHAYAKHAGTAPVPCGSGKTASRVRLNKKGNRQLNATIHRIAIVQLRWHPPAQEYIQKKLAEGKTKREAIRSLKRHLTNTIYNNLKTWTQTTLNPT